MRRVASFLLDHPSVVTLILLVIVVAQFFVTTHSFPHFATPRLFDAVEAKERPNSIAQLAIGVAGVAAMVGGFAGVVVVFGLSSDDSRFRQVRLKAATSLRRNWMSVVTTPFVAAFGAFIASVAATAGAVDASVWVLEACVLLAGHGAVRLVVVLYELVKVVHASDISVQNAENTVDTDEFYGND